MVTMCMLAEIAAARQFRCGDRAGDALGLLHHLGRKLVRQVVLADDDLDIHAEIVGMAQNLDHAPHRVRALLR